MLHIFFTNKYQIVYIDFAIFQFDFTALLEIYFVSILKAMLQRKKNEAEKY